MVFCNSNRKADETTRNYVKSSLTPIRSGRLPTLKFASVRRRFRNKNCCLQTPMTWKTREIMRNFFELL